MKKEGRMVETVKEGQDINRWIIQEAEKQKFRDMWSKVKNKRKVIFLNNGAQIYADAYLLGNRDVTFYLKQYVSGYVSIVDVQEVLE